MRGGRRNLPAAALFCVFIIRRPLKSDICYMRAAAPAPCGQKKRGRGFKKEISVL